MDKKALAERVSSVQDMGRHGRGESGDATQTNVP